MGSARGRRSGPDEADTPRRPSGGPGLPDHLADVPGDVVPSCDNASPRLSTVPVSAMAPSQALVTVNVMHPHPTSIRPASDQRSSFASRGTAGGP